MLATSYVKFRCSRAFLAALAVFVLLWLTWNLAAPAGLHFDSSDFGRLNLFLSLEASLSVALLLVDGAKQERLQHQQLAYMQHLLEATLELLQAHKHPAD